MAEVENLTKVQQETVDRILECVRSQILPGHEIKRIRTSRRVDDVSKRPIYDFASLGVWTGRPDSVVFDHAFFFIGPRGGVTYPVSRKGHQVERPFKWNYYKTVVAQRKHS